MSYQPGIPTGTVPLNQDYLNIQGNFTSINNQFLVDHVPLTSSGISPDQPKGYHMAIHLVPVSTKASNPPDNYPNTSVPAATPGYGQLLGAQTYDGNGTDQTLFFLTGANKLLQLTSNILPVKSANGYTFLPGGLLVQWGRITGKSGSWPTNDQVLTFATENVAFAFNCFAVWTTFIGPTSSSTGDITINSVSATNFHWQFSGSSSSSFGGFYWLAIGN